MEEASQMCEVYLSAPVLADVVPKWGWQGKQGGASLGGRVHDPTFAQRGSKILHLHDG